jgi:hypothetical protein
MSFRTRFMGAAAPLALFLLAAGTAGSPAVAQDRERVREAEQLCLERAQDLLRDRGGGRDVEIDEIVDTDEDDEVLKIQGYMRVDDRNRDRRGVWLDCDVNFEGDNRVVYFDEDNFFRSLRGRDREYRGGNRESRRRDPREGARAACRDMAEDQGYELVDVTDRDRTDNGARLDMRLRRNDRRFDATCVYNGNRDEARFVRLEGDGRRRN